MTFVQSQSLEITLLNDLFRVSQLLYRGESLLQLYSYRTCQVPTENTRIPQEIKVYQASFKFRCRNIAIMATDTKEEIAGAGRGRRASLRMREAGIQHTGGQKPQSRGRVSRQRSIHRSASPRRILGSPPPKHTPPLEDEWSTASRGRGQRSCSQSPRPVSPAPRSGHSSSPPTRRVSTPLYVIGHPGDSEQVNTEYSSLCHFVTIEASN